MEKKDAGTTTEKKRTKHKTFVHSEYTHAPAFMHTKKVFFSLMMSDECSGVVSSFHMRSIGSSSPSLFSTSFT